MMICMMETAREEEEEEEEEAAGWHQKTRTPHRDVGNKTEYNRFRVENRTGTLRTLRTLIHSLSSPQNLMADKTWQCGIASTGVAMILVAMSMDISKL